MKKIITLNAIVLCCFVLLGLSPVFAQQNFKLINTHLVSEQEKNSWLPGDISEWVISDQYTDETTGITHTYIQQRHHRVAVFNAISVFAIKDNNVVYFKPGLVDHLENKVNADKPSITPVAAVGFALKHLGKSETTSLKLMSNDTAANVFRFQASTVSNSPVKVQLVYRTVENRALLAWDVSIEMKSEPHWWNVRVDALTGAFIDKNDFTVECGFDNQPEVLNSVLPDNNLQSGSAAYAMPVTVPDYRVFGFPLEAPSFGSNSLLPDPSNPVASPYGWHDVDGVPGEEFIITRGNNVYSYEDANADNIAGYSPSGGSNLHFDFPYVAGAAPATNQNASLTNLFYINNAIHDLLYPLGFTEANGNFQQNNYGKGGLGGDYVLAEGFDGSGTNNANFNTPPDGTSGRMQMYLFSGNQAACSNLNITSSTFTGAMTIGLATFSSIGSVTDTLILITDAIAPFNDACSAITNNIAGKVALIDRNLCSFISKAQAAIAAGAVGVIIANNAAGAPPGMSGTPVLSVPCVSVSQADGNTLKSALLAGTVVVNITVCSANQLDGSFDNGIVAHEYGHGVSNRLTGGPSQASCLSNGEQGGEGWSDWLALMLTIEPGDQGSNSRGIGTYAISQPTTGAGIRRYPYSTNMSINPQTYSHLALSAEVHNVGEIWCDAIWDMSWLLIDNYGFSSSYSPTSGNYLAIQLVLEGMKLQPCGPGFLDARDAILTADAVLYNNAHRCLIWQAFARRGMGFNALQGSANVAGDETEGFNLPPYCLPPTQVPVAAFTSDLSTIACGGTVHFTDQSIQAFNWAWNFGDQTTSTLQNPTHTYTAPGTYNVKLVVTNPLGSDSVVHTITVTSTFTVNVTATPTTICNGDTVQLNAVASGSTNKTYAVSNIPYAPVSGTGTVVSLTDEQMSSSRAIGFTFNFFGNNYTNFYLSSNGFITFSSGMLNPYYAQVIPSLGSPNNFIALCWNDLNPGNGSSSINFFTTGSAPNRKLVINYNTAHYGGTIYPFVVQAILYETTNEIEIHTTTISNASAFDPAGSTAQGVENLDGTVGVAVPGRNNTLFSASNDAYRFIPYTAYAYTWLPGNLNGAAQNVIPVATGTYTVKVTDGTACFAPFNTPVITVNSCTLSLNLNVLIQGFYSSGGTMQPVLNTTGLSNNTSHCDSIIVELHNQFTPSVVFRRDTVLINTSGQAIVTYPSSIIGGSYFIVVRHRNSIETWSKLPVTLSAVTNYDFIH